MEICQVFVTYLSQFCMFGCSATIRQATSSSKLFDWTGKNSPLPLHSGLFIAMSTHLAIVAKTPLGCHAVYIHSMSLIYRTSCLSRVLQQHVVILTLRRATLHRGSEVNNSHQAGQYLPIYICCNLLSSQVNNFKLSSKQSSFFIVVHGWQLQNEWINVEAQIIQCNENKKTSLFSNILYFETLERLIPVKVVLQRSFSIRSVCFMQRLTLG